MGIAVSWDRRGPWFPRAGRQRAPSVGASTIAHELAGGCAVVILTGPGSGDLREAAQPVGSLGSCVTPCHSGAQCRRAAGGAEITGPKGGGTEKRPRTAREHPQSVSIACELRFNEARRPAGKDTDPATRAASHVTRFNEARR